VATQETVSNDTPLVEPYFSLLARLKSDDRWEREKAAVELGKLGNKDSHIIDALLDVAKNDRNPYPSRAARRTLRQLGIPLSGKLALSWRDGKEYTQTTQRILDFLGGFLGSFILMGGFWFLLSGLFNEPCDNQSCGFGVGICMFFFIPLNVLGVIAIFWYVRWVAIGVIIAYLMNFLINAIQDQFVSLVLGIPFFIPIGWN
jgi:hypothetical protein